MRSVAWPAVTATFEPRTIVALPPAAYDDRRVFAEEQRQLFTPGTALLYVGHDALLPPTGHRRADADPRLVLSRDGDRVHALANVCTHACRPVVTDDDAVPRRRLACAFHGWSFDRDGSLVGARGLTLDEPGQREQLALTSYPVLSWHGFHFVVDPAIAGSVTAELSSVEREFAARGAHDWLDLDDWVVLESTDDVYEGDWKLFVEVYGDCYHVPPYHPGLASFVDCDSIEWSLGANHHVQFLQRSSLNGRRSPRYERWAAGLAAYHHARGEPRPAMGVAWMALYPNLMYEAYAGLRVLSVVIPTSEHTYVNRVHYLVPADMESVVPGLPAAMKAAYDETVDEDRALVDSRRDGLRAAASLGLSMERYRPVLDGGAPEAGVAHFHDWYRARMGA